MGFDAGEHYRGEAAAAYDDARVHLPKWQAEQASVERFLHRVAPRSVIDVPVGTGRFLPLYRGRVIGIDISEDMLAQARRQVTGAEEVVLRAGDITALPVDDGSADVAVCVRLFNLVPFDLVADAMGELARVSRGHMIVGIRLRLGRSLRERVHGVRRRIRSWTRGTKVTPHDPGAFHALLAELGLTILEQDEIDRWPDGSTYLMFLLETP